jgi:hypothetical protein
MEQKEAQLAMCETIKHTFLYDVFVCFRANIGSLIATMEDSSWYAKFD